MTDEQKWLVLFGRGWVDVVDVEDHPTKEAREVGIRLRQQSKFVYDFSLDRIRLKESE